MDIDLSNICCWGDYDKLLKYNTIDKSLAESAINRMNSKLMEIDMWKGEDDNQDNDTQLAFYEREMNIKKCIQYLKKLFKINTMMYQMNSDIYNYNNL
jgi:hypothetical protein